MKSFILCGGFGTRLNLSVPKILAKVKNKTILEIQVDFLRKYCDITLLTGYKNEHLKKYIKSLNLKEIYSKPTGTSDAIKSALRSLNDSERVLFIYGDIYPDINLKDFLNSDTNKEIHLCIHKSKHPEDSDLINFKDNKLISVIKKPHSEKSGYSSCCLFLTDKRILKYDGKDFMKDILEQADTSVYLTDSEMLDLGTTERLKYANDKNSI